MFYPRTWTFGWIGNKYGHVDVVRRRQQLVGKRPRVVLLDESRERQPLTESEGDLRQGWLPQYWHRTRTCSTKRRLCPPSS